MTTDAAESARNAEHDDEDDSPSDLSTFFSLLGNDGQSGRLHGLLVGEVMDTHHPDLHGHLFVRWSAGAGQLAQRWLRCIHGVAPRRLDRVLLAQPANWNEPLVVAVVEGAAPTRRAPANSHSPAARQLVLDRDECLRICDADGRALCEIASSTQGAAVRLLDESVDLQVRGKLRLSAETIEIEGGRGGIDVRTEADAVVRARFIRLN